VDTTRSLNQAFACRYERHCRKLGLIRRFQEAAPGHLEKIALDVRSSAGRLAGNESEIAGDLHQRAADLQSLLGANNFEVALCAAAAESWQFISYSLRSLQKDGEVPT
jgi:hypothetical protein